MKISNNMSSNAPKSPSFGMNVEIFEGGLTELGKSVNRDLVGIAREAKQILSKIEREDSLEITRKVDITPSITSQSDFFSGNSMQAMLPPIVSPTTDIEVTAIKVFEKPEPLEKPRSGFFAPLFNALESVVNAIIYPITVKAGESVPASNASKESLVEAGRRAMEKLNKRLQA